MAEQLPIWQDPGVEPPALLKTNGWQPGMKPSAQHMNWLFNRIYKCLEEIQAGGGTEELEQELKDLQLAFATHITAKATVNEEGHIQLSNLINGTSETKATTEKAVSDAVAHIKAWGQNAINAGDTSGNPNTTEHSYILTDHANSPGLGVFWHIQTYFYSTRNVNKGQIAISYNGPTSQMFTRHLYADVWSPWRQVLGADMINVPYGVLGLDANGKIPPSLAGGMAKLYDLDLTANPTSKISMAGLSNYKNIRAVFTKLDVNMGSQLYLTFNNVATNAYHYFVMEKTTTNVNPVVTNYAYSHGILYPNTAVNSEFFVDIDNINNGYPKFHVLGYGPASSNMIIKQSDGIFASGVIDSIEVNSGAQIITKGRVELYGEVR